MATIKVTHLTIQESSKGFYFLLNGSITVDASADITWENEDSEDFSRYDDPVDGSYIHAETFYIHDGDQVFEVETTEIDEDSYALFYDLIETM